jgi:sugar phosphate isomerase/epimerase
VRALVELHHRSVASSASAALRLLDGLDPAAVGVIHDIGNLVFEGYEDLRAGLEMLDDLLAHVHVKNAGWRVVGQRPDGTTEWAAEWAELPEGQIDVPAYLRLLHDVGYDGWITVENFTTARPLAERIAADLEFLRAADRQAVAAGGVA